MGRTAQGVVMGWIRGEGGEGHRRQEAVAPRFEVPLEPRGREMRLTWVCACVCWHSCSCLSPGWSVSQPGAHTHTSSPSPAAQVISSYKIPRFLVLLILL